MKKFQWFCMVLNGIDRNGNTGRLNNFCIFARLKKCCKYVRKSE